jgi:hypothetical protein
MWIKPDTLQVFKLHSDIRAAFPNTSFPVVMTEDDIASVGVLPVTQTPAPAFDRLTEKITEAAPTLVDNAWTQQWSVVSLTTEEQQQVAQQVQQEVVTATQKRLDDFAKTRFYDGILSLCTYATSTVPKFQAEGQYGVNARDATWATLYGILDEVLQGTRPMPSGYDDIAGELPVLTWPS